jgi:DNA-directed RNA polymerase subunit E'/Rpb7
MEIATKQPQKFKKRDKIETIYSRGLINRNIVLPITSIGKNISENIEENIKNNFEGKCIVEGFIKPKSSRIISYSSGLITRGCYISFEVIFECEICFPVEGMNISCIAKNITKAGIKAESETDIPSPVIVFIARDHHFSMDYFSDIKEGDKITVKVIGQRFELNDKFISVIGELIKPKREFGVKSKEEKKAHIEF